eukprot:10628422-Alexandrium_andersonii.AAC.1
MQRCCAAPIRRIRLPSFGALYHPKLRPPWARRSDPGSALPGSTRLQRQCSEGLGSVRQGAAWAPWR